MIEHSKPTIGSEERAAISAVLKSNYLAEGDTVKKFEAKLNSYIGGRGALATSTGTLALHLALVSLQVKKGDEVIIPSYVCRSVLNSLLYSGAKPVVCDVNEEDYNLCFKQAKKKIGKKTKALVVTHMFGCPADIDKFKELEVPIIEDCAHAIGAEYKEKKVGSWGDLAIFSFEGTKYITTGEGGMVLSNRSSLFNKLKRLKEPDSLQPRIKYTYRMTNLQAAVGLAQLSKLDDFIAKRRKIAAVYNQALAQSGLHLPIEFAQKYHVFHRYMVKTELDIDRLMQRCLQRQVKLKQPVKPLPLHRYLGLNRKAFPHTERIMKTAVSVPIYPSLSNKQVDYIISTVNKSV